MATETSKKRLALAVIDFLNTSTKDGTISAEDAESIEIATNCIAEAFKVDPSDQDAVKDAVGSQNLLAIYNVYEKLKGKGAGASKPQESKSTPSSTAGSSTQNKEEAEKLKGLGNQAMQQKDYATAIDYYTKALDIVPLNPIYLSNRAAAYSGWGKHEEARNDAELAVAADPKYSKAWSRLGLAKFALGDAKGSMEAYKAGMDVEGGGSEVMRKGYETAKKKYEEETGVSGEEGSRSAPGGGAGGAGGMPDLSSLASMLGGGGGGGGMPDLGSLMQNPMMRQMAQNLMSNPGMMENIMSNPRVKQMAESFGRGGGGSGSGSGDGAGAPSLSEMMNDPSIAEMARNLMGGMGGAGRGNP